RRVLLPGEAGRRTVCPADAPAGDKRIEHDVEELAAQLERALLRAGRGFAGKERQRAAEIAAGEAEQAREGRRQRAAAVEETIDRAGDVLLVAAQATAAERAAQRRGQVE